MNERLGLYAQLYVKRKDLLFPLIDKYYGVDLKSKTHGEAISIYYRLLMTNEPFRIDVDKLIAGGNFNNAISDWKILNVFRKEENKVPTTNGLFGGGGSTKTMSGVTDAKGNFLSNIFGGGGGSSEENSSIEYDNGGNTSKGSAGASIAGGALGIVGGILGALGGSNAGASQSEAAFYDAIAVQQKNSDTMKLLIIGGVSLGILALATVVVIKMKK